MGESRKYNKLVRDKIPEILDKKGISYEKRTASLLEYKQELIKKLVEEAQELAEATQSNSNKFSQEVAELADVLEVIEALKKLPEYSGVDKVKAQKRQERGGFDQRIILKGEK